MLLPRNKRGLLFLTLSVEFAISNFKHKLTEVEKCAISQLYVPKGCIHIGITLKVIFDPKKDIDDYYNNFRTYEYGVEVERADGYAWFRDALHEDLMKIFVGKKIPEGCNLIYLKVNFKYCVSKKKIPDF